MSKSFGVISAVVGSVIFLGAIILLDTSFSQKTNSLKPVELRSDERTVKGSPNRTVVLIEYGDFQCPACASYASLVKIIAEEFNNDLTVAYRHFPLSQHKHARLAAYAAESAGNQGKFWEMHDLLYASQDQWSSQKDPKQFFIDLATSLTLDINQFVTDLGSEDARKKVEDDYQSALSAGVASTPSFYLNGMPLRATTFDNFRLAIQEKILVKGASNE